MGRDQDKSDAAQFEWVNAWASSTQAGVPATAASQPATNAAPLTEKPGDQLARDIAEIARTRDALTHMPVGTFSARRGTQALTLVPSRTTDAVPVVIGGVLALVMLTVFGAAAAVTKLSR